MLGPRHRIGAAYAPIFPLVPRRLFLHLSIAAAAALPVSPPNIAITAALIREHCTGYLSARGRSKRVLWRGGESPGFSDPPSDLFDASAYGADGAAFFSALDININTSINTNLHVAAADRDVAAAWGVPASIWPLGDIPLFKYYYWDNCSLFYDENISNNLSDCGQLRSDHMDQALEDGKEVLFDAPRGFFVVREDETAEIVRLLDSHILP